MFTRSMSFCLFLSFVEKHHFYLFLYFLHFFSVVVGLLDISIPSEIAQTDAAAIEFEGLSGANTNHTTAAAITAGQSGEDSNCLNQEQLNSSPGRSPHASKAGWTVTGSLIFYCNTW